jgi:hypothetical protein
VIALNMMGKIIGINRKDDKSLSAQYVSNLRRQIRSQLRKTGFVLKRNEFAIKGDISKQKIRDLHSGQRSQLLDKNRLFLAQNASELLGYFASGSQIDPAAINPELVEVKPDSLESRLFKIASLYWSVPVSQGFGRRLRFLVRDRQNGCLIGLIAIGDPVFNLSARDNWIGWSHEDREKRLVHVMDAYVLGSLPPYSYLICGKLIAALIGSEEIKTVYDRKYLGKRSIISNKLNRARLVLLTTTSALGRSSVYNRLSIPGGPCFIRIGTTRGFGHFHFADKTFKLMRDYLKDLGDPYASGNRFGMGPNWKMRVVRKSLESLGLDGNAILKHGIEREVYAIPIAANWREVLMGSNDRVKSLTIPAEDIARYCLARWIVPRAHRDSRYKTFKKNEILDFLNYGGSNGVT